jgi:hypothetical protein
MSKELTPLKALEDLINFIGSGEIADTHELCEYVAKRKDIVETALKRIPMLEKELCFVKTMEDLTIEAIKDKKLKALEIIKNKRVDFGYLIISDDLKDFNEGLDRKWKLTQEEYDLLKEVLYENNK